MAALSSEQRVRHAQTLQSIGEVPTGYAFQIPATPVLLRAAAEFFTLERLCCPFFDFRVDLPTGATSFQMVITGGEGIKAFIHAEFGSALPARIGFEDRMPDS
jgi:hypothetical protein